MTDIHAALAEAMTERFIAAMEALEKVFPELRSKFVKNEATDVGILLLGDATHIWMQVETRSPEKLVGILEAVATLSSPPESPEPPPFTRDAFLGLLQRAYARSTPPTAERPHPFVPVLMDVAPPGTPHFPLVYPDSPIDPSKLS
jgi:hypothetical protein